MPPLTHPQAQFVPIPPDLDLNSLVENTPNFDYVMRIPMSLLEEHTVQSLEQMVLLNVVIGGKPLVIEGWEERYDRDLFSPRWLEATMDKEAQKVRDLPSGFDIPMSMGHYLRSMRLLTDQVIPSNYRSPKRQRLYLKDIDTPDEWAKALKEFIPETFFYLNECVESRTGGAGAVLEPNEYGQMKYGKGIAPAGDLMSSLPPEMRAQNMMCYIGHESTYTPTHREMCASLGHNIMIEASQDGYGEKEGSSIWFMTETKEREVVSEYFLSMLGHDIEVEKHFAQINAWKKAPFNVWVVEQKPGDLILIPPLAPHQVWNRGTRTMKAAWNRTTIDTLELALHEALPRARLVCRDEQYKNKAIIYYTLVKYYGLLERETVEPKMWTQGRIKQLIEDFKRLFALYTEVLVSEMFSSQLPVEKDVEMLPYDSNVTCSYCRCNIFNRFLTCRSCIEYGPNGEEDTYDICMECYAMGRSCACISKLSWVQQWEWSTLTQNHEVWRQMLVKCEGSFDVQKSPQPLDIARKRFGRKPVAHICQEQLKLRPYRDPKNPLPEEPPSEDEPEVDEDGRVKKKKSTNRRSVKAVAGKTHPCHVCFHHEWNWKLAGCTTCNTHYCYGVLWRAFDLMPQEVMEDRDWTCPRCLGHCSCGKCRKSANQVPYAPKGTLLGHDTKKVADFRSVESLVDFSKTNLTWLRGENDDNPHESARMKKLKERAELEKSREDVINQNYLDDADPGHNHAENNIQYGQNMIDIDPQLLSLANLALSRANSNMYQSPYAAEDSEINGYGAVDDQWLSDKFDPELARSTANDPSQLLSPVASMVAPGESGSSPLQPGQNRMMGAGYYQQGNSIDKILYDAPQPIMSEASGSAVASAPNFSLSDLVPHPKEANRRKRSHESGDDEDFYTSKRQKHILETKRRAVPHKTGLESDDKDFNPKPKAANRQPHRNVGKPQAYIDLGEESMPFTEDDIVVKSTQATGEGDRSNPPSNPKSRFAKKPHAEKGESTFVNKRRSVRATVNNPSPATNSVPKERKSAWLARKEAVERGESPSELSQNPKRQDKPNTAIDISSDSDHDGDNGHASSDNDGSLFSDPESLNHDIEWRVSKQNPNIKVGSVSSTPGKRRGRPRKIAAAQAAPSPKGRPSNVIDLGDSDEETILNANSKSRGVPIMSQTLSDLNDDDEDEIPAMPVPKRRGRPSKNPMAMSPAGFHEMLSLQEKLAMKGRRFKIVTGKRKSAASRANSSHALSARVDVALPSATKTPELSRNASPQQGYEFRSNEVLDAEEALESNEIESVLKFLDGGSDDSPAVDPNPQSPKPQATLAATTFVNTSKVNPVASPSPSPAPEPTMKGPTVVRVDDKGYMSSPSASPEPSPPAPTKTIPTIIRKDDLSYMSSPPPVQNEGKKGPTVVRKSDDFPLSSLFKPVAQPVRKAGPTVVRLMNENEESDASNSSSDEGIVTVRPAPNRHGRGRGSSVAGRGMMARRERGRRAANHA